MADKDAGKFECLVYVLIGKKTDCTYRDYTENVFKYYYSMVSHSHYSSWRAFKEEVRRDFLRTRELYKRLNNEVLCSKEQVRDLEQLFYIISEI